MLPLIGVSYRRHIMQTKRAPSQCQFEDGCSLHTCTRKEHRSVIRFLISDGVKQETKKMSKEWHNSSSPKPKKFWTQPSARKILLTPFWEERGVLLEHCTPQGYTITSASYSDLLKNHLDLQSDQSDVNFWLEVSFCNMTMLSPILPVQKLQQSKTCTVSVFHIHHSH
jgi:hypothetical protein